jgi:glutamate dehydrogenase
MVSHFNKALLSPQGYLVLISDHDVTLPNGEVVENGTQFRNHFHHRTDLTADFFVPCGGRPAAVNLNNVHSFMYQADGKTLRFKYIVEGANLFFTQDARLVLEKAGVILFKDASANKGGVTSSSLEVLAAMSMSDEEFAAHMMVLDVTKKPVFYQTYVAEVQTRIDMNARLEFECLWKEHARSDTPYAILTNLLSERITDLSISIQSSSLYEQKALRETILKQGFPQTLQRMIPFETLLLRLPTSYLRALFASQLASRFVYACGLQCPEFAFYEFVQSLSIQH